MSTPKVAPSERVSQRNAERRLGRVLTDERYGAPLARMTRSNQARVLELIDQNRGAEARKLILELDAVRRGKESTIKRVRKFLKLPAVQRKKRNAIYNPEGDYPVDETSLFWRIYDGRVG